jgi:hypothetical protein
LKFLNFSHVEGGKNKFEKMKESERVKKGEV